MITDLNSLCGLSDVLTRRRCESVLLYEPTAEQNAFHLCDSRERLVIGPNRAGKTICAAQEITRCVLNKDPFKKYPRTGICKCVAKTNDELAFVMYKKLFRADAFKIIRDPETEIWRAYRPWMDWDRQHRHLAKPAPPLIPQRYIREIAWENKKQGVPKLVKLTTGWEMIFHSSEGKAKQGDAFHLAWIDEEIIDESWYIELSRGLIDHNGMLVWSATPQTATEKLYKIHQRAQRALEEGRTKWIREFNLTGAGNPHITKEALANFEEKLDEDEEQIAVRLGGVYAIESGKVFPEFSPLVHEIEPFDIPPHWTKYATTDPGLQVCASLLAAVPPPDEPISLTMKPIKGRIEGTWGDTLILFDELYIRQCQNADQFGREFASKTHGQSFETFLIDSRNAKTREVGSGKPVQELYSEALRKYDVSSYTTGHDFLWGTTNLPGSVLAIKAYLRVHEETGRPQLLYFRGLNNWKKEMREWFKLRKRVGQSNKFVDSFASGNDHAIDCLRYLCAHEPKFVKRKGKKVKQGLLAHLERKKAKKAAQAGESYVSMGPS